MSTVSSDNSMSRVMGIFDFRLLFAGSTTSLLGDQFALIATPWLVLKLTGDPLVLGIVLALEGAPRALFMLVGGAVTDRFSPRLVMLVSDIVRLALTICMALAIFSGSVQMWMVYVFSLGFGLTSGFAIPAGNSIVPSLVAEKDLPAGNSLMMGTAQIVGFIGPTIAGMLIGSYSTSSLGIGLAFFVDALSFAVSAACLWLMKGEWQVFSGKNAAKESIWDSILVSVRYLWNDPALRLTFLVIAGINFLFTGPMLVGIPVLANQRLPEGATAYGLLMSAIAAGNLLGYILAGTLPRPSGKMMTVCLIGLMLAFSLALGVFGFIYSTWVDVALLLVLGAGNGYIALTLFTWMQTRTPKEMLGRVMSMVTLSGTGLIPISQAISGAVSKSGLNNLFISAAELLFLLTIWSAFQPGIKVFSQSLTGETTVTNSDVEADIPVQS